MAPTTMHVVGSRGQITIPAAMRRALAIEAGDKVAFRLVDDELRIHRVGTVVEYTAGSLRSHEHPEPAERLREIAENVIAADVVRRGKS